MARHDMTSRSLAHARPSMLVPALDPPSTRSLCVASCVLPPLTLASNDSLLTPSPSPIRSTPLPSFPSRCPSQVLALVLDLPPRPDPSLTFDCPPHMLYWPDAVLSELLLYPSRCFAPSLLPNVCRSSHSLPQSLIGSFPPCSDCSALISFMCSQPSWEGGRLPLSDRKSVV